MPDVAARRVLDAWTDRLAPAEETAARARWEAACRASIENREVAADAARRLDALLHDDLGFQKVEQSLEEGVKDPTLHRALDQLWLRLLPHRVRRPDRLVDLEVELAATFACYRAEVGARRLAAHEVTRGLQTSTDTKELEATWRAAVGVGRVAQAAVREAVRLRNEHARRVGYDDFRALRLAVTEVDAGFIQSFLADLEGGTEQAWRRVKQDLDARIAERHRLAPDRLGPWHYGEVFLQGLPPRPSRPDPFAALDPVGLARATYGGLGLDVEAVLSRSDLYAREDKNPHAFCTHLDRRGDVRILCNVVPGRRWTRTMLHELGHAVYDANIDRDLPWTLVRPPHAGVTEGVAMLFDRLVHDETWCREVAGLEADLDLAAQARQDLLAFVRWGLVVSRFEEALYRDPGQDLDAAWWDLVERLQGIARPDPVPEGGWASKIHVACHPVYYHAYLLGQAVASSLARWIREDVAGQGLVGNVEAGRALVEKVFRPGASRPWQDLMGGTTGRPVGAADLLADLAGA